MVNCFKGKELVDGSEPGESGGRPLAILLFEEHEITARAMLRLLGEAGHTTRHVRSAQEAIVAAIEGRFDLLILQNAEGYGRARQTLVALRAAGVPTPAIVITSWGGSEEAKKDLAAGFRASLLKPVTPEQVLAAIAAAVDPAHR